MMHAPLALPPLSQALADTHSLWAQKSLMFDFPTQPTPCRIQISPQTTPPTQTLNCQIRLQINTYTLTLLINEHSLSQLALQALNESQVSQLGQADLIFVLESVLETYTQGQVQLQILSLQSLPEPPADTLPVQLTTQGGPTPLTLALALILNNETARHHLHQALNTLPNRPAPKRPLLLKAQWILSVLYLTGDELEQLKTGALIRLDNLCQSGQAILAIEHQDHYLAQYTAEQCTLNAAWHPCPDPGQDHTLYLVAHEQYLPHQQIQLDTPFPLSQPLTHTTLRLYHQQQYLGQGQLIQVGEHPALRWVDHPE